MVTAWLVVSVVVVLVGIGGALWALTRAGGPAWTVIWTALGLTVAAFGGLLVLAWYWAIHEGHLTG